MNALRNLRGFKILNRIKTRNLSLTLLAYNGSQYRVLISSYWLGIRYKHRLYVFDNIELAQRFYQKLVSRQRVLGLRHQFS